MPFGVVYLILCEQVIPELRLQELEVMRADEEGMLVQYVPLVGSAVPRTLSHGELKALRMDLLEGWQ